VAAERQQNPGRRQAAGADPESAVVNAGRNCRQADPQAEKRRSRQAGRQCRQARKRRTERKRQQARQGGVPGGREICVNLNGRQVGERGGGIRGRQAQAVRR